MVAPTGRNSHARNAADDMEAIWWKWIRKVIMDIVVCAMPCSITARKLSLRYLYYAHMAAIFARSAYTA